MRRRILLLIAAFVVALVGTTAVFTYVSRVNAKAAAEQDLVEVLVATSQILPGTTGEEVQGSAQVELRDVPRSGVPEGALHDLGGVATAVTAADIYPGEVLIRAKFVDPVQAGAIQIPDDLIAMTVTATDPQRVAGFVKPGSEVAVFHTYETDGPDNGPLAEVPEGYSVAPGKVDWATRLLIERAKVIAVGPTALHQVGGPVTEGEDSGGPGSGQEDPKALVTLAVPVEDAQSLAHAAGTGKVHLGLLSENSRTGYPNSPVDNRTLTR